MTSPAPEYREITPEIAQRYLGLNDHNRALSEATVEKYTRDMEAGAWSNPSYEPIIFDEDGRLIDGQHRLRALIKAKVTITFLVVTGVPKEAQQKLDTGRARSVADVLQLQGEGNAQMLASVARMVHRIDTGTMGGAATVSTSEILRILEKYPDIRHSSELAQLSTGGRSQTPVAPSVFGAAHWMIAQVNGHADADLFLWRLYNLVGEPQGSPVLALSRRANEIRRNRERVHQRDYLAMAIKAWNMDALNRTAVKIATYSKTGTYVLPDVRKRKVSLVEEWDAKTDSQAEEAATAEAADQEEDE